MATGVTEGLNADITAFYKGLLENFPSWLQNFINLFLLVILLVGICILIWKFYTILSRKNMFKLNLNKFDKSTNSNFEKIFGWLLYFLEYIIIIPFFIFFWFALLTFFLLILTEIEVGTILIIAAIFISAIRMTAYYREDLSKELAIMLTLDLLVFAILTQGVFSFERIINNFSQLPIFAGETIIYFLFIVCLEIILRILDFVFSFSGLKEAGE
jgi:hypothetical protein